MNHPVEQYTWNLIRGLMLRLDPDRAGWCIDAGVGYFDFYCEWMHALGYPTLAIEPALSPEAIEACQRAGIPLVEAALADRDGITMLHSAPDRDLRSIEAEIWGGMSAAQAVHCVTLQTLIEQYQIDRITALKLDIEGAEPAVIGTLPGLASEYLPLVISFEWGGERPASTRRGAWQPSQQKRVKDSFLTLYALGYRRGLIIGQGDGIIMRTLEVGTLAWEFEPEDNWGNAILTRADIGMDDIVEYAQTTVGAA